MMIAQNSWHDQDQFWGLFEPFLFNEQRRSNAKGEVENLIELLNIQGENRVLDLCCGTGRHSLELSHYGYPVVGVDRTAAYITRARQLAGQEGLGVDFVLGDMRDFCRPETFDVVINMFGSFGYFEDEADDRRVVMNMHASLGPGGRFLIETAGKEIVARNFQAKDWYEDNDTLVLMERQKARDLGLDMARFESDLVDPNSRAAVDVDVADAQAREITATPAFFINGRYLRGAKPFEDFARIVNEELTRLGLPVPDEVSGL